MYFKNINLKNKTALVTGAGKGIGRQVALELAKEGWQVMVSARTEADLDSLVQLSISLSGSIKAYPVDVTNENEVKEIIHDIESKFGAIELAILNAGTYIRFGVEEFSAKSFSKQLAVNVIGTVNCFEHVLENMKNRQSGHIVVVSSLSAYL